MILLRYFVQEIFILRFDKIDEELGFIQDQITTTEVNMAHLHNFTIQRNSKKFNALTQNA